MNLLAAVLGIICVWHVKSGAIKHQVKATDIPKTELINFKCLYVCKNLMFFLCKTLKAKKRTFGAQFLKAYNKKMQNPNDDIWVTYILIFFENAL